MKFTSIILSLLAGSTAAFGPSLLPVANRLSSTTLNEKFEVCIAAGPGEEYNGNLEITMTNIIRETKEDLSMNVSANSVEVHVYDTDDDFEGGPNSVFLKPTGGGSFSCGGIYVTNLQSGKFFYYDKVRAVEIAEGETMELPMECAGGLGTPKADKFDIKIDTGDHGIENLHVKLIDKAGNATPVQNIGSFPANSFESVSINTEMTEFGNELDKVLLFKPPNSQPSELYHLVTKGSDKYSNWESARGDFFPFPNLNDKDNNWLLAQNIHSQ